MQGQPTVNIDAAPRAYDGARDSIEAHRQPSVVAELEQRIHELQSMEDEQFGGFTRLDWILCVAGSLVLPYLFYVWFWP